MCFEKCEYNVSSYTDDNSNHTYDWHLYTVLIKLKNCRDLLKLGYVEICIHGLGKLAWKQMVISVTSLSQLKNHLVSTLIEQCKN